MNLKEPKPLAGLGGHRRPSAPSSLTETMSLTGMMERVPSNGVSLNGQTRAVTTNP